MYKELKFNSVAWIVMVFLILLGYFVSENNSYKTATFIGLISIIKFLIISYQFMEVKNAHVVWKVLIVIFGLIFILSLWLSN